MTTRPNQPLREDSLDDAGKDLAPTPEGLKLNNEPQESARALIQTEERQTVLFDNDEDEDKFADVQLDKPHQGDKGLQYMDKQTVPASGEAKAPPAADPPAAKQTQPALPGTNKAAEEFDEPCCLIMCFGWRCCAKKKKEQPRVEYMELYKYSTWKERMQVKGGLFFSVLSGTVQPMYAIIIGRIVEMFDPELPTDEKHDKMLAFLWIIVVISIASYITSYLGYAWMQISAERLSFKLRAKYLASLMRQEVEFFEKQQIEALPSKIAEYFTHISEGSGEKMGQLISVVGASLSGIIIGLIFCPYYALCLLVYLPFGTFLMKKVQSKIIATIVGKMGMNARLGGFTEEMLSAIKLTISFGQERLKLDQYKALAEESYAVSKKASVTAGLLQGCMYSTIIGFSTFSWTVGYFFIKYELPNPMMDRPTSVSDIVLTYQALMFGMFTVLQIQAIYPTVIRALTVGHEVISVIERAPLIDSPHAEGDLLRSSTGIRQIDIEDGIRFKDVHFRYPTAPDHVKDVFNGASFMIKSGTTTAIVGPSGSGKSTIVQMINRFYDPSQGEILYGSTQLKKVDLTSLREMIGWVGQEPVLVVGTIRENLMYGNKDATEADLDRAVKLANAQFIYTLEKKLDTYVGSSTVLNLSGGQKQRIAIARALIKRPQILVLDEATSALDPKSEAEVQNAILNVQKQQKGNLTIIMIAHRLQTIMTADNLLYLENSQSVIGAQKKTPEYKQIMDRLKKKNYAHQADNVDEDASSLESDEEREKEEPRNELIVDKKMNMSVNSAASYQSHHSKALDEEGKKESRVIGKEIQRNSKITIAAKAAEEKVEQETQKIQFQTRYVSKDSGWGRLLSLYQPHAAIFAMVFFAFLNSFTLPVIAYLIIQLQFIYYSKETNENWESETHTIMIFQYIVTIMVLFVNAAERALFGVMGEKLTFRLRLQIMEEIVHKQISWFDREDRAPGIITSILSADITSLNGMTSEVIVTIFELVCVTSVGLVGGIYFCWQAAILCFLLSPIMVVGMYMMATMQWGNKGGKQKGMNEEVSAYEKSNALLSDVVINYRTVISLGQKNVDQLTGKFVELLTGPMEDVISKSNTAALYYALGVAGRTIYISLVFVLGIEFLVFRWGIDSTEVFTGTYLLFFVMMSIGGQAANVPSIAKAKASAIPVFSIIDEKSTLDIRDRTNASGKTRNLDIVAHGKIEFKDCNFNYPTRAQKVMDNFNLEIPAGAKIALVGHSGCGKSTLTNILLRFYNIEQGKGEVLIDGKDLDDYDVHKLRKQFGYVMQEPVLFNADIKTNILFGKPDATDEEVYISAQKANALEFIEAGNVNLTDAEILENLDVDYKKAFAALERKEFMGFGELQTQFGHSKVAKNVKQMILALVTKASDKILAEAQSNMIDFMLAVNKAVSRYGAGWEDIVILFEWRNECAKIINSQTLTSETRGLVSEALAKELNFYGAFNEATILEWAALRGNEKTLEDLIEHIRDRIPMYRMNVVSKRYDEIVLTALEKMRVDGKFTLHEGFKKDCGLKGGKLSGGQKQRIAIARALIKNPRILILDEATSALDEHSQEAVQQTLDRAMEGRTSIVIAHRLSTIRNCDILFVLGNGHILESGTYKELSEDYNSHFNVLKAGMEN